MKQLENQVAYHEPETWMHRNYRCLIYQSYNEFGLWRIKAIYRPGGTLITEADIPDLKYKASIGKREATERRLHEFIDWDMLSSKEKEARTREFETQRQYLW